MTPDEAAELRKMPYFQALKKYALLLADNKITYEQYQTVVRALCTGREGRENANARTDDVDSRVVSRAEGGRGDVSRAFAETAPLAGLEGGYCTQGDFVRAFAERVESEGSDVHGGKPDASDAAAREIAKNLASA